MHSRRLAIRHGNDGFIHLDTSTLIKAGYASSAQERLSLSFKMKVPGFFGADRSAKNGHPFSAISEGVRALESPLSQIMSVHMMHNVEAHRIFLTLLTDSVQHMLKLHPMMEAQFFQYCSVLGTGCDDGKRPLPQPQLRARTYAETNPSAQRATQLRSVLARVCSISRQNLNTNTVP
jgi:hypothetical protein